MDRGLYKGIPFNVSLLDFDKYIVHSLDNKAQLYSQIKDCQVDNLKIRCDIWRLCLGVINIDSTWEEKALQLQKDRERYTTLVEKHTRKGQLHKALSDNPTLAKNPLGKLLIPKPIVIPTKQVSSGSIQEADDKFLEDEVRKDVERTYQQRQFFRNPRIVKILSKVLFIWSKQYPDISYKQGINEISASVIWTYFQSTIDPNSKYKQYEGIVDELKEKYLIFHSNEHAEADIYSIFEHMMNSGHKQMFKAQNDNNKEINPNSKNNTPILQRIIRLSDIKFKLVDPQLFRHIKLNQVTMRTFLLRWIRCIHTRQFQLEESFSLWDNIFLSYHMDYKQGLNFIDCTTLSMLMYLRDVALKKDAGFQILQLYQKYPKVQGKCLQQIVNLAWTIKDHLQITYHKEVQKKKQLQINHNTIGQYKPMAWQAHSSDVPSSSEKIQATESLYPNLQSQTKKSQQIKKLQSKSNVEEKKIITKPKQQKQKEYQFNIVFSYKEWKQIESLMKKSFEQNTDLESRSLTMKVMNMFSQKEQQQIKKIQNSNSLIDNQ